jgi:hypothetical protein
VNHLPGRSLFQNNALIPTVVDGDTIKVDGTIVRGRVRQFVILSRAERNGRYLTTV